MLHLNKIHHIAIICSDYNVSKRFYTEILGFKIISEVYRKERDSYKLDLSLNGTYYYRLKEIDQNGHEDLSKVISITRNDIENVKFGPNPTCGELNIAINSNIPSQNTLKIINTSGQLVSELSINLTKGVNDFLLNIDNLTNGIYRIIISGTNGLLLNEKIVLLK